MNVFVVTDMKGIAVKVCTHHGLTSMEETIVLMIVYRILLKRKRKFCSFTVLYPCCTFQDKLCFVPHFAMLYTIPQSITLQIMRRSFHLHHYLLCGNTKPILTQFLLLWCLVRLLNVYVEGETGILQLVVCHHIEHV